MKTTQVECIGSKHDNLLPQLWTYESDVRMTRQAASDSRTAGCTLASGIRSWHDRSYIASISLLGHDLTVKVSPWMPVAIVVGLDEQLHVCVGIPNAICYSLRLAPG